MARQQRTLERLFTKLVVEKQSAKKIVMLVFVSLLLAIENPYSQDITFDCLTLDQGLSQSTVTSIVQDDDGYMWFGTIDGLNKFDGYNFTVYKNNPTDSNSLADNIIMSLCKCQKGFVWIGTLSRGLCRYDSRTGKFKNYPIDAVHYETPLFRQVTANIPFSFSFLAPYSIKALYSDANNNLWAGTFGGGLYQFDKQKEMFIHVPFENADTSGLAYNIMSICETVSENEITLWLGTYGGGLVKYDLKMGFTFFNANNGLLESRIMAVCADTLAGRQILWLATFGGGLIQFDISQETFSAFQHIRSHKNSISSNFVMSIKRDRLGDLWVGTFNAGLNKFDPQKKEFICYQHDPTNVNSLGSNEVHSLYEDRSGVIWIGTNFGYGINRFSRGKNLFRHYFHNPANKNSLSENVVFSLFEDSQGILWVGTFQTGLNKFDRQNQEFTNYRHEADNRFSISDNHIRAIYEDSKGRLWIGTFNGGLNYFDKGRNRFEHFLHDPKNSNSLGANQVRSIYEDESGFLWIAVQGAGVDKFDVENQSFTHFRNDPHDANTIGDDRAYYLTGDKNGCLWISTFGGGLCLFDFLIQKFRHFRHDPEKENSLCHNRILTIHIDQQKEGIVWLGSFGSGFDRLNLLTNTFTHYTEENGLANNVVYGILPDEAGNLWISTNKGISKFNPETEMFVNYDITDGLQSNEFNAGAYFRSRKTGEMFFGGVNGFNCFLPQNIRVNEIVPNVVITSFKIFDTEMTDSIGPLMNGDEIELTHKANYFSFEFSVLDFVNSRKNQYAYKLDGVDENWIYCGNRRYINYTNLDPGKYIFRAKGANCDGVWNDEGISIKLNIIPRYYQTWWWHPTVVATLILLVVIFLSWRMRQKVKRSIEMERVRLNENEKVRKDISADFHDELGQKLTRISLFSEIIKKELKTIAPQKIEFIDKIIKVANELSNSTRDFIWSLDADKSSLYNTVVYLKDFGDEIFDKTGVNFRINGISKDFEKIKLLAGWRRQLILLFKEAMHNALKHAGAKNIIFSCDVEDRYLLMMLCDDGQGMMIKHGNNGHGLKNMKIRAEKIKGQIEILSDNKCGTKIIFRGEIPRMSD